MGGGFLQRWSHGEQLRGNPKKQQVGGPHPACPTVPWGPPGALLPEQHASASRGFWENIPDSSQRSHGARVSSGRREKVCRSSFLGRRSKRPQIQFPKAAQTCYLMVPKLRSPTWVSRGYSERPAGQIPQEAPWGSGEAPPLLPFPAGGLSWEPHQSGLDFHPHSSLADLDPPASL